MPSSSWYPLNQEVFVRDHQIGLRSNLEFHRAGLTELVEVRTAELRRKTGREHRDSLQMLIGLFGVELQGMRQGVQGRLEVDATTFTAQTPKESRQTYSAMRAALYEDPGSLSEVVKGIVESPPPHITVLGYQALRTAIDYHVARHAVRQVDAGNVRIAEADERFLMPWASAPICRVAMRAIFDERIYRSALQSGRSVTASTPEFTELINRVVDLRHGR